jgi:hypothetical protein
MSAGDSTQLSAKLRSVVANALAYLRDKQSNNGGFCFFKFEHLDRPNLRDTFYATSALKLWRSTIARGDAIVEFLRDEKKDDIDGLFYFARTMQTLGSVDLDRSELTRIRELILPTRSLSAQQDTDRWLERIYRTLDLQMRFLRTIRDGTIAHHMLEDIACDGGYGETPNLRETALSLRIIDLLGREPQDRGRTRRFVDGLQHPGVGFTDRPGSQCANLDILVAGIECCSLLGLPLRYPNEALGFVFACQSADGSFSRVPVALPDIAYTHQALQAIAGLTPGSPAHDGLELSSSGPNADNTIDMHPL